MNGIRLAKISDFYAIKSLGSDPSFKMTSTNRFYEDTELKEFIKDKKTNIFLVLFVDGKIQGFLYAKVLSRVWVMLDGLYIRKNVRNNGYGSKLLVELKKQMHNRGINYVSALLDVHDLRARKFLKRRGYTHGKQYYWIEKEPV